MKTERKNKTGKLIASHNESSPTLSENELAHKFLGYAQQQTPSFSYDVSGTPALLHQYAILCETSFNRFTGLRAGSEQANFSALAVQGTQCLGGVQALVSFPQQVRKLPCEQQGFNLQKCLPELDLYNVAYGEILDFIALPDYQESIIMAELLHRLVDQAIGKGVQYLFAVSTMAHADRYSQVAQLFGLECALRPDIKLPDYDEFAGGHSFLTILDLTMLESDVNVVSAKEALPA